MLLSGGVNSAPDAENTSQQLLQLRQQIKSVETDLERDQSQAAQLQRQLRRSERKIGQLGRTINDLNDQLHRLEKRLKTLRQDARKERVHMQKQRHLLAGQIRSSYATGSQEYLKLLLNQSNPAIVGRMLTYYGYFNRARGEEIERLQKSLSRISQLETEIIATKEENSRVIIERQREHNNLKQSKNEREQDLQELNTEIKGKDQQLAQLRQGEKELQQLLTRLQEAFEKNPLPIIKHVPFKKQRGKMRWPTRGTIINAYGSSRRLGKLRWNGVVMAAKTGTSIKAISDGHVVYADWLRGYGLLLIIDHGDGYMSLYGHTQSIYVELGEQIDKGKRVAEVGNSGGIDNSALYFEIRYKGKPVNPKHWVSG